MQTIESPSVPVCHSINGGLPINAEIVVHGAVFNGHNKSFAVNLRAGSDVALHFNPRFRHFSEHTIVLNTFRHGDWQTEERHKNKLSIGDTFCLRILIHQNHFLVELNGRHICHYQHRIPPNQITHLEIEGDVSVQRVKFINCEKYGYSTPAPVPGLIDTLSPAPMFPPAPPAYSSYSSPQPQMPPNSSYPNLSTYSPAPTAYSPAHTAYPPAPPPTYGMIMPVAGHSYVKTCGCSTEHCHHGTHWSPPHHHDSHHYHHHHC